MQKDISIKDFIEVIKSLPSDEQVEEADGRLKTQKGHWLTWLREHENPVADWRTKVKKWNARYAYEKAPIPEMLLYLVRAIPLKAELIRAAEKANERSNSQVKKLGAILRAVPWSEIYQAIWEEQKPSNAQQDERMPRQGVEKKKKRSEETTSGIRVHDLPVDVPNLALSIRQPYVELILLGIKKIEFRPMLTRIRGRVYLYASLTPVEDVYEEMGAKPGDFPTGVIVGTVEIVDCTGYPGDYEWHLARPERLIEAIKPERHPQPSWFKPFEEQN
jgi:hypothetical protein